MKTYQPVLHIAIEAINYQGAFYEVINNPNTYKSKIQLLYDQGLPIPFMGQPLSGKWDQTEFWVPLTYKCYRSYLYKFRDKVEKLLTLEYDNLKSNPDSFAWLANQAIYPTLIALSVAVQKMPVLADLYTDLYVYMNKLYDQYYPDRENVFVYGCPPHPDDVTREDYLYYEIVLISLENEHKS